MWEGIDFAGLGLVCVNFAETGERVLAVNVHGTGPANSFATGASEGQGRILLVLDFDESVQDHWAACVKVYLVGLQMRFGIWLFWVLHESSK